MNFVFFGLQGSGKGTQAKIIAQKHNLMHISTGDLLRSATGSLKQEIDSYILKGNLVPDELIVRILKERIKNPDCQNGVILDGFPRTIEQAKSLEPVMKIDSAFNIEISDPEAIKRMKGRWNCQKCKTAWNYVTEPKPKVLGICDYDGEKLSQRADDINDEAIATRLRTYHEEISPLLKFYNTVKVNGEQPINKVTEDIEKAIKFLTMFR